MTFKKLHPEALYPVRATSHSAGLDIHSIEDVVIYPGCTMLVKTGLTFEVDETDCPERSFIGLYIRSSLAYKHSLMLANGVGVIDMDYAGNEIGVLLHNAHPEKAFHLKQGEKVAQLIVQPHVSTFVNNATFKYEERVGGFGSTDGK